MTNTLKTTLFALLVLSIAVPTSMAFAVEQNATAIGTVEIKNPDIAAEITSLKAQLENTTDVKELSCSQSDYVLILKQSDNSPACVKSSSQDKLIERGWGILITA